MVRALLRCDGAQIPPHWQRAQWDVRESINHQGAAADLNLRIQNLSHALLAGIEAHAADLVRIAAYVYAADQLVGRGGLKDVYGRNWRRQLALCVPVGDPAFWNDAEIRGQLQGILSFLSDDQWEFCFGEGTGEEEQLTLDLGESPLLGSPDSVILFSGGADSLCCALEVASVRGGKPILVSHRSSPNVSARQKNLVQEVRQRSRDWDFPHISVWVHRKGSEARETSQRTRSFLFASLGAAVASQLGIANVFLPDNGIVSLNLPINDQLVGALASRTSHPKFIAMFNELARSILPGELRLSNPLWSRTRAEVLDVLKASGAADLLQETVSCAYARGRPLAQPHCGVCSQCIDRRFGAVAAGLEQHDLAERYGLNIFSQALPEGIPRTMALSYVKFALRIQKTPKDALFDEFPELTDCVLADDPVPQDTAEALIALLQRHAATTLRVMHEEVSRRRAELVAGDLPDSCLLKLVIGPSMKADSDFRHSPDYRMVVLRGREFRLTPRQAHAVQILDEAHEAGASEVGQDYILTNVESRARRLRDIFKNSDAWGTLVVPGERPGTFRLNI